MPTQTIATGGVLVMLAVDYIVSLLFVIASVGLAYKW